MTENSEIEEHDSDIPHEPGPNDPVVIKRYASRKLYDAAAREYVTLEDIARYIRQGREVQIIDKKTGDVLKPASLKAPAKGVRYNLLSIPSREEMFARCDWAGGYLYAN